MMTRLLSIGIIMMSSHLMEPTFDLVEKALIQRIRKSWEVYAPPDQFATSR